MLKLYGFAVSNYFNMVRLSLLEKGIEHEVVNVMGRQDDKYRQLNPSGKVPCLVTEQGVVAETSVILEYLEELGQGPAFLPSEPYARAQVHTLMRDIELYMELAARPCYPATFFGGSLEPVLKGKSEADLRHGVATLKQHAKFAPYVAGAELSLADFYLLYSLDLASAVAAKQFGWNLLGEWPEAQAWMKLMHERPFVQQLEREKRAELAAYLVAKTGA